MAALNLSRETDNVWGGFIHIVSKLGKRGDTRLVKIFQLKPELPDFHGKLYLPRKPRKTSLTMKAFNFTSYAKSGSTMFYQANARLLPRWLVHRYIDDVANSSCMPEPYDSDDCSSKAFFLQVVQFTHAIKMEKTGCERQQTSKIELQFKL